MYVLVMTLLGHTMVGDDTHSLGRTRPYRPTPVHGVSPEEAAVIDRLDVHLEDPDVLEEIEMTSNLIIAASEASGRLSQHEIDVILGLHVL